MSTDIFSSFMDRKEKTVSIAQEQNKLIDKLFFNEMGKKVNQRPGSQGDTYKHDPRLLFLRHGERVFDLTSKISMKCLVLVDFSLNIGQCAGFLNFCKVDDDIITHAVIENCSLTDEMLATLLDGLMQ